MVELRALRGSRGRERHEHTPTLRLLDRRCGSTTGDCNRVKQDNYILPEGDDVLRFYVWPGPRPPRRRGERPPVAFGGARPSLALPSPGSGSASFGGYSGPW
jgi:hypothetical protein